MIYDNFFSLSLYIYHHLKEKNKLRDEGDEQFKQDKQ